LADGDGMPCRQLAGDNHSKKQREDIARRGGEKNVSAFAGQNRASHSPCGSDWKSPAAALASPALRTQPGIDKRTESRRTIRGSAYGFIGPLGKVYPIVARQRVRLCRRILQTGFAETRALLSRHVSLHATDRTISKFPFDAGASKICVPLAQPQYVSENLRSKSWWPRTERGIE